MNRTVVTLNIVVIAINIVVAAVVLFNGVFCLFVCVFLCGFWGFFNYCFVPLLFIFIVVLYPVTVKACCPEHSLQPCGWSI